jgi:hypothetical protein
LSKPFRSDKRKKELLRLKKQEEKRQRRFGIKQEGDGSVEGEAPEGEVTEGESEITEAGSDESEGGNPSDSPSEDRQPETKHETE